MSNISMEKGIKLLLVGASFWFLLVVSDFVVTNFKNPPVTVCPPVVEDGWVLLLKSEIKKCNAAKRQGQSCVVKLSLVNNKTAPQKKPAGRGEISL